MRSWDSHHVQRANAFEPHARARRYDDQQHIQIENVWCAKSCEVRSTEGEKVKKFIGIAIFVALLGIVTLWPSRGIFAQSGHTVTLTWNASANATSYNVKRSLTPGTEVQLGIAATPTYIDSTGVAGVKYFYVVTAVNQFGESASSNEVSASFLGNPPLPPTGLAAVSN
jgi:hypothetical protein